MGFINPDLPTYDPTEWRNRSYLQRVMPLAQHWVEHGFGIPISLYLLYVVKVAAWAAGGVAVILTTTPGLGGLADFGSWWSELLVYQKAVVWTLLWEVLGLGCGFGPLTLRLRPPFGGILYWLRPGTLRMAPWPWLPCTGGSRRGVLDVVLYLAVLASGGWLLLSPGKDSLVPPGNTLGMLDPTGLVPLALSLAVLGLRDKTVFLAARSEHYLLALLVFVFPAMDIVVGLKVLMVALWWGAATSKLNEHFPYALALMVSNSPLHRTKWMKQRLYREYPTDLRPSRTATLAARAATAVELTLPALLLFSDGGIVTTLALAGMVAFHLNILSLFPVGAPLEWNLFFIYSALVLFGHYGDLTLADLQSPVGVVLLAGYLLGVMVLGNMRPDLVSFLPSMRYYTGNSATSLWCFRNGSDVKLDRRLTKAALLTRTQLARVYDEPTADLFLDKAMAWRCMHVHGRALVGLLPRALDHVDDYTVRDGELIAGVVLGWNFGDGHLHNETLLRGIKARCHFRPGELVVVILESQPIHRQRQRYRIVDAATGLVEEGYVTVAEMVARQPWLDGGSPAGSGTIPVHDVRRVAPRLPAGHRA